jgi:dihydrofolate reductase
VTVTLFIATSLDGYIAGPDDDLSWLFTDTDYGFTDFYAKVDALIIGRGTYDVFRGFGEWPYPGRRAVVVSRQPNLEIHSPDTTHHSGDLPALIENLERDGYRNVWLVGGGELVRSFLERGLLDRVTVSLHPVLLGRGVPLFPSGFPKTLLMFQDAEAYESGLVQLNYLVAPEDELD